MSGMRTLLSPLLLAGVGKLIQVLTVSKYSTHSAGHTQVLQINMFSVTCNFISGLFINGNLLMVIL